MKMTEIKKIAKEQGINPGKKNKESLIKTIQIQEGNEACYKTREVCDQDGCCWRGCCLKG